MRESQVRMRKPILILFGIAALVILALLARGGRVHAQDSVNDSKAKEPAAEAEKRKEAREDREPRARIVAGPVETVRVYRLPIGPWTWVFTMPESVDLPDIADRFRGFFGMFAILGVASFLSENRAAISRRVVLWGLALAVGFRAPGVTCAGRHSGAQTGGRGDQGDPRLRPRRGGVCLRPRDGQSAGAVGICLRSCVSCRP